MRYAPTWLRPAVDALEALHTLAPPAPHVFEDIEPRPVRLQDARGEAGLLTVRSGPECGQLALVTADAQRTQALRLAALGDTVGGLHTCRLDGAQLTRRFLMSDVSTHAIGSRETDLAAWVRGRLVVPSQDGRLLRVLDPATGWTESFTVPLPGRVTMTAAVRDALAVAALLAEGRVVAIDE